jgi:8-oxo-dGTP pyrophosphatase MutT (NUDIX family)
MKQLPIETQAGIKVIPIISEMSDPELCKKCLFDKEFENKCSYARCEPYAREDGVSVYFIEADSVVPQVTIPVQTYKSEKHTLANSACAIIPSTSGKFLTTTRRNTDILCLPGGKEDPGETHLDAIVREVAEETGLHLRRENFKPIYSEIVVGEDGRDFYCVTFVSTLPLDEDMFSEVWSVEPGIQVKFSTEQQLLEFGTFTEYNKLALKNYRRWQDTV